MEIQTTTSGTPAISSLEIAKITGKEHAHIMRDIRRILEEAEIDQSRFGSVFLDSYKREQPCFLLPKREFNLVISGYSVKHRLALIDRLEELEARLRNPILFEKQELLKRLLEISTLEEHAAYVAMIAPANEYGSFTKDGRAKHGVRRACFVASKARATDAKTLFLQSQALNVLKQLYLPI